MQRRNAIVASDCYRFARQQYTVGMGGSQQTRTWHRCKRNSRQQLGIIRQPVALERLRPGMIEYIFASGMRFQIQRHGPVQNVAAMQQQVMRRPACFCRRATGLVQCEQKSVAYQGVVACQPIPLFSVNIFQVMDQTKCEWQGYGFIEFDNKSRNALPFARQAGLL